MSEAMTGAMRRVGQALSGLLTLARVVTSTAVAARHVTVATEGLQDDDTEALQSYGLQSRPKPGAVAVQAALGAHAESLVTILVHDRRYTIALAEGEVALVDDLGAKVHLTRTGIVIDAATMKLGASATRGVARLNDLVAPTAGMTTWMTQVAAGINSLAPGAVFPALPTSLATNFATVSTASTKAAAE